MINFCHIAPTQYLPAVEKYNTHLLLAHLIEEDSTYRSFYKELKERNPNVFYHIDNSAFEMFKRGQPMYDSNKLIDMAKLVGGDSIVMSDYPKEPSIKTIKSAESLINKFKDEGFKTFFCPQSELGKTSDLLDTFEWAINNDDIDYIGVSILACPIGLGLQEQTYTHYNRDESYRMQRYLARWQIFNMLDGYDLLNDNTIKRFHCLGMTDGPNEIKLLEKYHKHIFSWDSSSAIWHGIHNIRYDNSPTGIRHGKFEKEVNFDIEYVDLNDNIKYNMNLIDIMCGDNDE